MRKWSFRLAAALVLPAATMLSSAGQGQADFPVKAIRVIAPVPPGSPPDLVARIFADSLAQSFGQPVVVDNRPGANQTIGLGAVAAASPDGYTLGVVSLPTAVVPSLMAKMPYDTLRDFAPVRELAWSANVLIVRNESSIRSVGDLIAAAKAQPGKLTYASGGNGTPAHVTAELLREQNNLNLVHVPFKGALEGINAVMAGHVDFMLAAAGPVVPQFRAGKVKAIAQTTPSRITALTDVPTFTELGFTRMAVRDWQGIVAPASTPQPVLARLSNAIQEAVSRPEMQERLRKLGMEPVQDSDPERFASFLGSEVNRWAAVARASGLQAQ